VRSYPDGVRELVYATRKGVEAWEVVPIAQHPGYSLLDPIGIVTEPGGGVRLLYAQEGIIHVGWFEGSKLTTAAIGGPIYVPGATVQRDGLGRIHVALYEGSAPYPLGIRYLLLGP
jgi:hypothetical protein